MVNCFYTDQSKRGIKTSLCGCISAFTIAISKMFYQSFCYAIGITLYNSQTKVILKLVSN
jgi:hypothetical protein